MQRLNNSKYKKWINSTCCYLISRADNESSSMLSPLHVDPWLVDLILGKKVTNAILVSIHFRVSYPHMCCSISIWVRWNIIFAIKIMWVIYKRNNNKSQVILLLSLDKYFCNDWKLFRETSMTFDVQTTEETSQRRI